MENRTRRAAVLAAGLGIGAGLMFILDPDRGRRRRGIARDKARHLLRVTANAAETGAHDLSNRTRGLFAESRRRLRSEAVSDDILVDRIRADAGHVMSRLGSLDIRARDGRVTLHGTVPVREKEGLLAAVSRVPGVTDIEDRLDMRIGPSDVAGGTEELTELRRHGTTPAGRLLAGSLGAGLVAYGFRAGWPVGCAVGTAGVALTAGAVLGGRSGNKSAKREDTGTEESRRGEAGNESRNEPRNENENANEIGLAEPARAGAPG